MVWAVVVVADVRRPAHQLRGAVAKNPHTSVNGWIDGCVDGDMGAAWNGMNEYERKRKERQNPLVARVSPFPFRASAEAGFLVRTWMGGGRRVWLTRW